MRVLIIGASSFIGTDLVKHALKAGHDVVCVARSGRVDGYSGHVHRWALGTPLPGEAVIGSTCAIHLAHDFSDRTGGANSREGTIACMSELRAAGVGRQIYFSSYSAGIHAKSVYGKTKYAVEQAIAQWSDVTIVRPGLVLGAGGIYGRIRQWAQRLPIIPLPDGGKDLVPTIEIYRLCNETLALMVSDTPPRVVNLFHKQLKSLRQLVKEAAWEVGKRPAIFPVPAYSMLTCLKIAAALHVSLPVNADNLSGFLANQSAYHASSLPE